MNAVVARVRTEDRSLGCLIFCALEEGVVGNGLLDIYFYRSGSMLRLFRVFVLE